MSGASCMGWHTPPAHCQPSITFKGQSSRVSKLLSIRAALWVEAIEKQIPYHYYTKVYPICIFFTSSQSFSSPYSFCRYHLGTTVDYTMNGVGPIKGLYYSSQSLWASLRTSSLCWACIQSKGTQRRQLSSCKDLIWHWGQKLHVGLIPNLVASFGKTVTLCRGKGMTIASKTLDAGCTHMIFAKLPNMFKI